MSDRFQQWREIDEAFEHEAPEDLEAYLAARGLDGRSLPDSIGDAGPELLVDAFGLSTPGSGPELSRYRIVRPLETGGQSDVFLAERSDGVYRKTVVIKFLSERFSMDILKPRFMEEMQLLADLAHPGVVPILDGGLTEDQRPWLVLDHIDGVHLDDYCSVHALTVRDVVSVFRDLCEALEFIHRRGVVHMDLKPSNVLVRQVNAGPVPVIIDFGIALEAASIAASGQRHAFGTRGYAAPEQLAGAEVDQRADIYSLGMMLAQVLAGGDKEHVGCLRDREREQRLRNRQVPDDLRQVIRKCTQQQAERRYDSADLVRMDLNNWLLGLPLIANRSRPVHVAVKSVRRHPLVSAVAALTLCSAVFFTWKYTRDVTHFQQQTLAEKTAGDELYNFISNDLFERLMRIGRVDALQLVAERSIEHLQAQDQGAYDEAAWLQSAIAYLNAGRVFDALEDSDRALAAFDRAEENIGYLAGRAAYRRQYLAQLATVQVSRGRTLATEGQQERTEQSLREALNLAETLAAEFPESDEFLSWEAHIQLGWHYLEYDRPERASEHIGQALKIAERHAAPSPEGLRDSAWVLNLSHAWQVQSWYEFDYGSETDALAAIDEALRLARITLERDVQDIQHLDNYRILLNQSAFFLGSVNRIEAAEVQVAEAVRTGQQLQMLAPLNQKYQRELAYSYTTAGEIAESLNDLDTALAWYQKGLGISRSISEADPGGFSSANDLAVDLTYTANILARQLQDEQARTYWEEAVGIMRPIQANEPDNKYYLQSLVVPLIQLRRYEEARPLVAELLEAGFNDEEFIELLAEHGLN